MTLSFEENIRPDVRTGCWHWSGRVGPRGYGIFGNKNSSAHRLAYEMRCGPVPDGLVIDHLCRNPLCVNPEHLQAVTQKENTLRGVGPTAINAHKTHCVRGHALIGHNLVIRPGGWRKCRACGEIHRATYVSRQARLRGDAS